MKDGYPVARVWSSQSYFQSLSEGIQLDTTPGEVESSMATLSEHINASTQGFWC